MGFEFVAVSVIMIEPLVAAWVIMAFVYNLFVSRISNNAESRPLSTNVASALGL